MCLFRYLLVVIALFPLIPDKKLHAQACPACSNPALQSSEKLDAGLDTLRKGTWRLTLNMTNGFDYQGGHPNWKGLSEEGVVIDVPLHEHIVSLDFWRTELAVEYNLATNWSVWLRVPYDIKDQTATVRFVEFATPEEQAAILRNRDIHHRTETYIGFSDFRLFAARRIHHLLFPSSRLDLAWGVSLPVGATEEDPLVAGGNGEEHLHIQFGTGTFDPLFELHYTLALSRYLSFALFSMNRLSLYENAKGYRGPLETTSGAAIGIDATAWLTPRITVANFSQSWAYWNGVRDPNSGLVSWNATLHLTFRLKNGLTLTPAYRYPIRQRTLSDEGDTFQYGPTVLLNVSYAPFR